MQFGLISNRPLLQGDFESMHERLAGMRNPDISVPNLLEAIMYAYVLRQKGENDGGEHIAIVHLDMQPQDMFELKVGGEFVPRTFILSTGRLCLSAASCNRDLHMTSRLIVT